MTIIKNLFSGLWFFKEKKESKTYPIYENPINDKTLPKLNIKIPKNSEDPSDRIEDDIPDKIIYRIISIFGGIIIMVIMLPFLPILIIGDAIISLTKREKN